MGADRVVNVLAVVAKPRPAHKACKASAGVTQYQDPLWKHRVCTHTHQEDSFHLNAMLTADMIVWLWCTIIHYDVYRMMVALTLFNSPPPPPPTLYSLPLVVFLTQYKWAFLNSFAYLPSQCLLFGMWLIFLEHYITTSNYNNTLTSDIEDKLFIFKNSM